jgi:pyruvate dehydrogenase (quinone)
VPDFPYARYADLLSRKGIRVDDPEAIGPAWDEALSADRPVVLEAYTDPNVPPLPPHISFGQAPAFMSSIFQGDPDSIGFVNAAKDFIAEYIPSDSKGE